MKLQNSVDASAADAGELRRRSGSGRQASALTEVRGWNRREDDGNERKNKCLHGHEVKMDLGALLTYL